MININAHLAIGPVTHLLEGQSGPVNRSRLPPDGKAQEDNHSPKGHNHLGPGPYRLGLFWRRHTLRAGLGAHFGGSSGEVGRCGGIQRRPQVFILGGHVQDILCSAGYI